jgi:hypothetical protein
MTSAVDVCNNALLNIGTRSSISSLTEASPEAQACNLQYDTVLSTLLRSAPWNFARKFATLGLLKALPGTPENSSTPVDSLWHTSYPPPPWYYSYAYPSDCVLARYVLPQIYSASAGVPIFSAGNYSPMGVAGTPAKFVVTSDQDANGNAVRVICTNESQAIICYTYHAVNPDLWDPMFYDAMQDALAGSLCMALTGKIELAKALLSKANDTIRQARAQDGNEGLTIVDNMPDWLKVRGLGGSMALGPGYTPSWGPLFSVPTWS